MSAAPGTYLHDDRAASVAGHSVAPSPSSTSRRSGDADMNFGERAVAAAGAAFISAILVNPLDVAKFWLFENLRVKPMTTTRLQAQAAGVPYHSYERQVHRHIVSLGSNAIFSDIRCSPSCSRGGIFGTEIVCPPDCFQYKGTLDVFNKVIRQVGVSASLIPPSPCTEGFARLWRGTNAALALAIPTVGIYLPCYDIFRNWLEDFTTCKAPALTPYAPLVAGSVARSLACIACSPIELARTRMQAFKEFTSGGKPPGMWKTLVGVLSPLRSTSNVQSIQNYRILWTGVGAQLARDVPFSAICWSTLEPIRRRLLGLVGEEANAVSVLGANFAAGFVAGSLAAGATCPLDVAKTRRQIEKDPRRALKMTTRHTLIEVWRDGGMKGLFTGVGPRVARAGPSVGIVVSFYEVVKHVLHQRHSSL
ncbi:hypothetical protein Taro_008246 [Colocasia esculenta]|uniref:Mitochondrial carrier protein MTM1 n=1 Tax=Colocasia esculenta TaxID=4460 RepID=A0A843TWJ9_COLES|nr:hypothetical protein [Colocasia esculenta]